VCAVSPTIGALVAARTVHGAGAAFIMPMAMGLLVAGFPPGGDLHRRPAEQPSYRLERQHPSRQPANATK
jgi:MFS family permease